MKLDQFMKENPHLTYLTANIHYNLYKEKEVIRNNELKKMVIAFTNNDKYGICESCSG